MEGQGCNNYQYDSFVLQGTYVNNVIKSYWNLVCLSVYHSASFRLSSSGSKKWENEWL